MVLLHYFSSLKAPSPIYRNLTENNNLLLFRRELGMLSVYTYMWQKWHFGVTDLFKSMKWATVLDTEKVL